MKLSLPIITSLLVPRRTDAAKTMLRKGGGDEEGPPSSLQNRKLTTRKLEDDINNGSPEVDLCNYHPRPGVFDPLPVAVTDGLPDKFFKIENAANITFEFSTCGLTTAKTLISIWNVLDQGLETFGRFGDAACSASQSSLSWKIPDNEAYYVLFGSVYINDPYAVNATWSTDADWQSCLPPTIAPTADPSASPSASPTTQPSPKPTTMPSATPSVEPSNAPSNEPSITSSSTPSHTPSPQPTIVPSSVPSSTPSSSPSSRPSSVPTSKPSSGPSSTLSSKPTYSSTPKPSSFPSSQPSRLTCEMVSPCDYDMEDDGMGDVNIIETYYPVCIYQETTKKSYYHQECYPESIIAGLGAGGIDPEHGDRIIVNCGCCPPDDMLPAKIDKVKGHTDACDGGLDCFAEGANVSFNRSGKDKSGKKKLGKHIYFQMCIDGDDKHWEKNFYVPSDDESASCGQCDDGDIIIV